MKFFSKVLLVAALLCLSFAANAASLGDLKTVYLLPMSNGLDQYLSISLTTGHVLDVVTDPQKADVIFTDHLGESFQQRLNDLYGATPKQNDQNGDQQSFTRVGGARVRGAAFLVDPKTRAVIWSTYERPKNTSPDGLKRAADKIANKLAAAVKRK
jgi:hypothetical protein